MAAPVNNPVILDLTDTYGVMLAGSFLACVMWGISSLQCFLYFGHYEKDPWYRKLFVSGLWCFDTANMILMLMSLWPDLIARWGDLTVLAEISPELMHRSWVSQCVESSVQLFFVYRIYRFNRDDLKYQKGIYLFLGLLVLMPLFQLIVLVPYDVLVYSTGNALVELYTPQNTDIVLALRSVTVAEDISITICLLYSVFKKGMSDYSSTRRMAYRLAIVTVNTGLWTAVFATIELILVATDPKGLQFCVVEFPLCSLYFSSLLATLNARDYIVGAKEAGEVNTLKWRTASNPSTAMKTLNSSTQGRDVINLSQVSSGQEDTINHPYNSTGKVTAVDSNWNYKNGGNV